MSQPELPLTTLLAQAEALGRGEPLPMTPDEAEVARQMGICNACRYCEGHCAVFPAMTRRLVFDRAAVHYLANLCHGCGACLHACQYAPPHEFAVSVPRAMARVRARSYADHAWPAPLGALYQRQGLTLVLALTAGLALFLMLAVATQRPLWGAVAGDGFYGIFPHGLMVSLFAPVFAFVLLALGMGAARFWRLGPGGAPGGPAIAEASQDVLRLHYLDGGHGQGCHNEDDAWTDARRHAHHLCFYGFLLCFASTTVATLYHYGFGWVAPYAWTSLPKLLGTVGGVAMVAGAVGLWRLNRRRHPDHVEASQRPMDLGFVALLVLVGVSGLALAVLRSSPGMPLLLCLHLGAVMAFFLTMPYGKFAHGVYRGTALLMWAVERRRPSELKLGSD